MGVREIQVSGSAGPVDAETALRLLGRQAMTAAGACGLLIMRSVPDADPVVLFADGLEAGRLPALWPPAGSMIGVEAASDDVVIRLVAVRPPGSRAPDRSEIETIRLVASLAAVVTAGREEIRRLDAQWRAAERVLDLVSVGIVQFDGRGGARTNQAATDILRRRMPGDTAINVPQITRWLAGMRSGVREAMVGTGGRTMADLVVLATSPDAGGAAEAMETVFLCDPDVPFVRHVELMRRQYGLTRLEAQLVAHLVDGDDLAGIAGKLHLSIHTVRAYLKRIFVKTGANRQSTLVRLVLRGVGQMAADGRVQPVATAPPSRRRQHASRKAPPPSIIDVDAVVVVV